MDELFFDTMSVADKKSGYNDPSKYVLYVLSQLKVAYMRFSET